MNVVAGGRGRTALLNEEGVSRALNATAAAAETALMMMACRRPKLITITSQSDSPGIDEMADVPS